jgi:hypothetical protein
MEDWIIIAGVSPYLTTRLRGCGDMAHGRDGKHGHGRTQRRDDERGDEEEPAPGGEHTHRRVS